MRLALAIAAAAATGCAFWGDREPDPPPTPPPWLDESCLPGPPPAWPGLEAEPVEGCPEGAACLPREAVIDLLDHVRDLREWAEDVVMRCGEEPPEIALAVWRQP